MRYMNCVITGGSRTRNTGLKLKEKPWKRNWGAERHLYRNKLYNKEMHEIWGNPDWVLKFACKYEVLSMNINFLSSKF